MFNPLPILLTSVVTLAVGFSAGWEVQSWKVKAAENKQLVKTVVVTRTLGQTAAAAATQAQSVRDRIVYQTKTITERIPSEIPTASDVLLSPGWVWNYNASLGLSSYAGPAGVAISQTNPIRSADALQTVVGNNGDCRVYADQMNELIDFYDKVKTQINGEAR
jgi:hypothetical protein